MARKSQPIPNGRDHDGRFLPGNAGGPGSPYPKLAQEIKLALYQQVTDDDIAAVMRELVRKASYDPGPVGVAAAKVLLDYLLGPPGKQQEPQNAPAEAKDLPPPPDYAAVAAAIRALVPRKNQLD
jgi:hypothetical protein